MRHRSTESGQGGANIGKILKKTRGTSYCSTTEGYTNYKCVFCVLNCVILIGECGTYHVPGLQVF